MLLILAGSGVLGACQVIKQDRADGRQRQAELVSGGDEQSGTRRTCTWPAWCGVALGHRGAFWSGNGGVAVVDDDGAI